MAKGCICYIINHTEKSVTDCVESLTRLKANYLDTFPAPIVMFHEAGLTSDMKARLTAVADIRFAEIDFSCYDTGFDGPSTEIGGMTCRAGYMHMIRFFTSDVFLHPALAEFDYMCRVDADAFIQAPIHYNLFAFAEYEQVKYGYVNDALFDHPRFIEGLWPAAHRFIEQLSETTVYTPLSEIPEGRLYYTTFELMDLAWFRVDPWQAFAQYLIARGGIYQHRWGDHTMRYIGVRSFMNAQHIRRMPNVQYLHQDVMSGSV